MFGKIKFTPLGNICYIRKRFSDKGREFCPAAAFTLLELMVVVTILGILAVVAVPHFRKIPERAREIEGVNIASALYQAEKRYSMEHSGSYTGSVDDLDIGIPDNLKFFNTPVLNSGDCLVEMTRTGNKYTICVSTDGNFSYKNGKGPIDFD